METLPPLPTGYENIMEITKTIEVEVESNGQRYKFIFAANLEVTFDEQANEIVIECKEEQIDNIY